MKTPDRIVVRRGFTLVELLVVIAIIGLLAGMLLPVLTAAQEKGRRADCINNLGQFGRAIVMYGMDHDEQFPSNLAALALEGYADVPEMFTCRSDRWRKTALAASEIGPETADRYCSYNLVTREADGAPLGSSSSGRMLIACDKDGSKGNVTEASFGGNHGGDGGHALMSDNSVQWVAAKNWSTNVWGRADLASVVGY